MGRVAFAIGQWRAGASPKAGLQFSAMKVHSTGIQVWDAQQELATFGFGGKHVRQL